MQRDLLWNWTPLPDEEKRGMRFVASVCSFGIHGWPTIFPWAWPAMLLMPSVRWKTTEGAFGPLRILSWVVLHHVPCCFVKAVAVVLWKTLRLR